jgi:hypothetical protein
MWLAKVRNDVAHQDLASNALKRNCQARRSSLRFVVSGFGFVRVMTCHILPRWRAQMVFPLPFQNGSRFHSSYTPRRVARVEVAFGFVVSDATPCFCALWKRMAGVCYVCLLPLLPTSSVKRAFLLEPRARRRWRAAHRCSPRSRSGSTPSARTSRRS